MKYHFLIEEDGDEFLIKCVELPECYGKFRNKKSLNSKLIQLLSGYLFENAEQLVGEFKLEDGVNPDSVYEYEVPYYLAFPVLLKYTRLKNNMSYQEASEACGLKSFILDYERYEMGEIPTLSVFHQIVSKMPGFPIEIFFQ